MDCNLASFPPSTLPCPFCRSFETARVAVSYSTCLADLQSFAIGKASNSLAPQGTDSYCCDAEDCFRLIHWFLWFICLLRLKLTCLFGSALYLCLLIQLNEPGHQDLLQGTPDRPDMSSGFADFDAGHRDLVTVTKFNFYGNRIVTASSDHRMKVWDQKDGEWQLIDTWRAHDAEIRDVRIRGVRRFCCAG